MGIVLVERPQPLGDDQNGPGIGIGPSRGRRGGSRVLGQARWQVDRGGIGRGQPGRRLGLEEVTQVVGQVQGCAVPIRGPLRNRLEADPLLLPGDGIVDLAGRAGLGVGDLIHELLIRVAPERLAAGQQLVEDDAQAEDVRAAIDPVPFAPGLLGAHVGRRPGLPGSLAVVFVPQRQPEVDDARLALRSIRMLAGLMSRWTKPRA